MIYELIVTSAPRGLQAGRSGFTTVCRTRGIHPDLATRLEAASGYRHVHPQGDPRNPVIFSYTSKSTTVGDVWVMSRVGDAGTDYTGRSNKIAHHVALQSSDLAALSASNPAAVIAALTASQGLLSKWAGEPHEKAAPPVVPAPATPPTLCDLWAALAGDAGWAGHLIERGLAKEATWVIAPPGTDLLSLFSEALALAAPQQRWQMSFTTYSLRGDEGRWLGAVAGTPEADAALAQSRIPVVDLTRRSMAPTGGLYTAAARGQASLPWHRASQPPSTGRPITPAPAQRPGASAPLAPSPAHEPVPLQPATPPLLPRAAMSGSRPPELTEWEDRPVGKPQTFKWLLVGLLCSIAIGGAAIFVPFVFPEIQAKNAAPKKTTQPGEPAPSALAETNVVADADRDRKPASHPGVADGEKSAVAASPTGIGTAGQTTIASGSPQLPQGPSAFELVAKAVERKEHLPIHGLNTRPDDGVFVLAEWETPADTTTLAEVVLQLPLPDKNSGLGCRLTTVDSLAEGPPERLWKCIDKNAGEEPVGTFALSQRRLVFRPLHTQDTKLSPSVLTFLPLRITTSRPKAQIKETWLQLLQPIETFCDISGGAKEQPLFQSAVDSETRDDVLRVLFLDHPELLRWKDLTVAVSADGPLSLSPAGEFAFGKQLPLPHLADAAFRFWWRPATFKEQSSFQEAGCLHLDPWTVHGGVCYLHARLVLERDRTIERTRKMAGINDGNQVIKVLHRMQSQEVPDVVCTKILTTIATRGLELPDAKWKWNELDPGPRKDLLDPELMSGPESTAQKSGPSRGPKTVTFDACLRDLKARCLKDVKIENHVAALIAPDFEERIEKLGPKPEASGSKESDKETLARRKWEADISSINTAREEAKSERLRDDKTLVGWAALQLDESCGQGSADKDKLQPPTALINLALWRALHKHGEAIRNNFACSKALLEGDSHLQDLADVADQAVVYLCGTLQLNWSGESSDSDKADAPEWPPVRIATFMPPPAANKAKSPKKEKSLSSRPDDDVRKPVDGDR